MIHSFTILTDLFNSLNNFWSVPLTKLLYDITCLEYSVQVVWAIFSYFCLLFEA